MLVDFFFALKRARLPVSITEYLSLIETLESQIAGTSVDAFYYLSRTAMVKDERLYDRFDQVFAAYFEGAEKNFIDQHGHEIPTAWLKKQAELYLSEEEQHKIKALGGFDALMNTLAERLREQKDRHQGGNKWIGTAGRSPFGAYGYNPEGVRIGQSTSRHRRAVKVWDKREYRNLDNEVELGTRNIKMALRRLRKFAREGAAEELDLDDTINATARQAGLLDIKMVAEKRNAVKVLLFLDVGGSMDDHVRICEELFSAAHTEFKHLEYFYFHNCLYESVWKNSRRRHSENISTLEVLRTYGREYKLIFVGDATMSPYEIMNAGGSIEHYNEESGAAWLQRMLHRYPHAVWLNPRKPDFWGYTPSVTIIQNLLNNRMYSLTPEGLDQAMIALKQAVN